MLPDFAYVRARTRAEALAQLREPGARIHAGGTDLIGCLHDGVFGVEKVVSIGDIEDLGGIYESADGGLTIGAVTSITAIAASEVVRDRFPGLAQAASDVASPQLRNQGTIGGNLCQRPRCWYFRGEFHCLKKGGDMCYAESGDNRYHAIFGGTPCYIVHPSDTAPMLVALGASVRVAGPTGSRTVALSDFFVLPEDDVTRENVLQADEIVTEVLIPAPADGATSSYRKVRERGAWDFALASVAISARLNGGRFDSPRIVLGGVAPIPWRSEAAEAAVAGQPVNVTTAKSAAEAAIGGAEPMEKNGYKVEMLRGIVEESVLAFA